MDFTAIRNLRSLNMKGNELNNLPGIISLMDNLVEFNIEANPMRQVPNLKYANLSQIKQYCQSKLTNEDINNMPENLKINYYRKNQGNLNKNNNNKINTNSPIFNYIKNNSELVINNTELVEIPCNEIINNVPENYLTVIDLSGNQSNMDWVI